MITLHHSPSRQFSSIKNEDNDTKLSPSSSPTTSTSTTLLYESPFAPLTLKLKRVSLTSAAVGIVGLPLLTLFYGSGDVPATGQLAVIATAAVTAVGSTVLLGYCFTPYVHTLELVHNTGATTATTNNDNNKDRDNNTTMIRMITRDILARQVTTVFDPDTDVAPPPKNNTRPFCNFTVRNRPYYIHADLVTDRKVRAQLLVGQDEEGKKKEEEEGMKKKTDEDEFL